MSTEQNKKRETEVMESLSKVSDILKLQLKVSEESVKTREKVHEMEKKFEKLQQEAYDTCPVCYEDISVKNTCCMPNCSHKMCKGCYYNWLDTQEKNTCPMCREEVFKNNLDIKTKRSTLQLHLDSLENEVAEMYEERRQIRKSMVLTRKEEQDMENSVKWLYNKYDQLRDEIFDNEQIMGEIREYKRDPEEWKRKKEKRLKWQIWNGYRVWRHNMKTINKEFIKKWWILRTGGLHDGYTYHNGTPYLGDEIFNKYEEEEEDEEVDISELNMFELPPEFAGDETRKTVGTYSIRENGVLTTNNRVVLEEGEIDEITYDDYDTDYDTDETTSMPSLIEATDQELEDMALEGTTFSEDEMEYDRAALNVIPVAQVERYIGEGAIDTINGSSDVDHMFHYIGRRFHFQQTDDSYRPRRLTYPENTSTTNTSDDRFPEENYSRQIVTQFYDSMEDANGRSARV